MKRSFLKPEKSQQQMPLRLLHRRQSKVAEAMSNLVGNKIAENITNTASKNTLEDPR